MKRRPDFIILLAAVFGLGVALTLAIPATTEKSIAAPASQLQAGVIVQD